MNRPDDAVLDEVLGAEAEGDAGDAGAGDQRGEVDAQLAEHEQRGDTQISTVTVEATTVAIDVRPRLPAGIVDRGRRRRHPDLLQRLGGELGVVGDQAVHAPADEPPGDPGDDPGDERG